MKNKKNIHLKFTILLLLVAHRWPEVSVSFKNIKMSKWFQIFEFLDIPQLILLEGLSSGLSNKALTRQWTALQSSKQDSAIGLDFLTKALYQELCLHSGVKSTDYFVCLFEKCKRLVLFWLGYTDEAQIIGVMTDYTLVFNTFFWVKAVKAIRRWKRTALEAIKVNVTLKSGPESRWHPQHLMT